jgi:hypothetical protein
LADEALGYLRASHWSIRSVHRKIFFAISLAVPHAFLSLCDALMSQVARK